MDIALAMLKTDGTRRDFAFSEEHIVLGRAPECTLRIGLPRVSRRHCELTSDGLEITLHDLGSSNGTFHNGKRITQTVLSAGDRIGVGAMEFLVIIDGQPRNLPPNLKRFSIPASESGGGTAPVRANAPALSVAPPLEPLNVAPTLLPDDEEDPVAAMEALASPQDLEIDLGVEELIELEPDDVKQERK